MNKSVTLSTVKKKPLKPLTSNLYKDVSCVLFPKKGKLVSEMNNLKKAGELYAKQGNDTVNDLTKKHFEAI